MTNEENQTKLYDRVFAEHEQYRQYLLTLSPEEILSHALVYAVREDIVKVIETVELSENYVKALLKSQYPLTDIYREWEKAENYHIHDARVAVENRAKDIIEHAEWLRQREER